MTKKFALISRHSKNLFIEKVSKYGGTKIYDGQVASGKYYSGNTITAVNKRYATDTNWGNSVYKYMQYLYDKI